MKWEVPMRHLPTIISALELQERRSELLTKPQGI